MTVGDNRPKVPVYRDEPLPGAHLPTRFNWAFGFRLTVACFIVSALCNAGAVWWGLNYTHQTNQRLVRLEEDLSERRLQRDKERDSIIAQIEKQRAANLVAFCSFLEGVNKEDTSIFLVRLRDQYCVKQ